MSEQSPWSLVYLVLVLIVVLALAYYASKWLSKRCITQAQNSKYLKVIDRTVLGQDKTLCIVKVGSQTMLLGVTQNGINKICDIPIEDLPQIKLENATSFTSTLKSTLKNNWGISLHSKLDNGEEKDNLDQK